MIFGKIAKITKIQLDFHCKYKGEFTWGENEWKSRKDVKMSEKCGNIQNVLNLAKSAKMS